MNDLAKLFREMPDSELIEAVTEIEDAEESGVIKEDGIVRKYHQLSIDVLGDEISTQLYTTVINIIGTAACRWKPKDTKNG